MSLLNTDHKWMNLALDLAKKAESSAEVPVGSILVLNNEIIGKGWNQPISTSDPTAHAEIIALRDAAKHQQNYRLLDTTLYVTLEPCIMCIGAMIHARIKRLVFGAKDPKTGAVCSAFSLLKKDLFNHEIAWQGGIMDDKSAKLLSDFFKKRRKNAL